DAEPAAGMLRLCLLSTAVLYNYTEASFYGVNSIWVLFLVSYIDSSALPALQSPSLAMQSDRDAMKASVSRPQPIIGNAAPARAWSSLRRVPGGAQRTFRPTGRAS